MKSMREYICIYNIINSSIYFMYISKKNYECEYVSRIIDPLTSPARRRASSINRASSSKGRPDWEAEERIAGL